MKPASKGDTVIVDYTCITKDGTVQVSSLDDEAVEFTIGEGEQIEGLEEAVIGMRPGEKKRSEVPVEKAYGPYHQGLVLTLDRQELPEDLEPAVGDTLGISRPERDTIPARVTEVTEATVTLDANHPLAGKELTCDIQLIAIVEQ